MHFCIEKVYLNDGKRQLLRYWEKANGLQQRGRSSYRLWRSSVTTGVSPSNTSSRTITAALTRLV